MSWPIWKDPDAGKDWGREKGMTENEMGGWHHQVNGHGFGWTPGVSDGQGGLVRCSPWGCIWLNWTVVTEGFSFKFCCHLQVITKYCKNCLQWTSKLMNIKRPGVLRFMGSQRVGHDWATELNWTENKWTSQGIYFTKKHKRQGFFSSHT